VGHRGKPFAITADSLPLKSITDSALLLTNFKPLVNQIGA